MHTAEITNVHASVALAPTAAHLSPLPTAADSVSNREKYI